MKVKPIYIASIVFFLIVNTTQLWEHFLGEYAILLFAIMCLFWLLLVVLLFSVILSVVFYRAGRRKHIYLGLVMVFVLLTAVEFPNGLINFGSSENKSLLIASREGAANCHTTLYLNPNNSFVENSVCFGNTKIKGNYRIENDTIFFNNIDLGKRGKEYFQFAVIKADSISGNLGIIIRFENLKDSVGSTLWIRKNEFDD